ncbi:MAG TPA: SRPBCC family protein [Prolixibacteraceae bacterium]|jgi:hypothetical protein
MLIIFIALIIVAIPFIVALFVKKTYSVEREIMIARPSHVVFNYLKYLKNQDKFSKWASMDPKMKKEYRGIDGTVGFVSAWESQNKNVGKGEQEIKKINEGKRIDYELRFIKPFNSVAKAYMTCDQMSKNETIVNWGFDSKMNYPMNLMLLFNMEKMIGNDLSTGLVTLKNQLENRDSEDGRHSY